MQTEHSHRAANTSTFKKLVGRLRGHSISTPTSTPPRDSDETSSRTASFKIRTPRLSGSPDSQSNSSARKANGTNGGQAGDSQAALDLWNEAYDALRDDPSCSGLVVAYENIISQELPDHLKIGGLHSSFRGKSAEERLELLTAITAAGLEKRRGSNTSQTDDMAKRILDSARGQVAWLSAEYDAASIAWAGFCTLTPLLLEPIAQRDSFNKGLVHVVGRIPWYTHLAELLRDGSWDADKEFSEQQSAAKEQLVKLNRNVLEFEMNCVCATASAWNAAARNVVGWNTLDQLVNSIHELDEQIVKVIKQSCTENVQDNILQQYRDVDLSGPRSDAAGDRYYQGQISSGNVPGDDVKLI
ncbi:hypothetical protein QQS21_009039 [Conoideocrella luteorostrata]|uniref:NWD NACHT-NTPase N-terminal domain-containing protein n=1 Tax=Conoideocrella luteorostrata TaxID=1105319 RepID=A0AAJ0CHW3_9HYPO|nr:hypothetical protein QQS21_009039 [Conoideocrella luteorostrata]